MPSFRRPLIGDNEVKRLLDSLDTFINPLEGIPWLDGVPVPGVTLAPGSNVIPHLLQREPRGWWITRNYNDIAFQPRVKFLNSQDHGSFGGFPSGTNLNLTLSFQPISGNTMVSFIATNASSATASITQTGATWVQVATYNIGSGSRLECWLAPNLQAPGTSVVYVPSTTYTNWCITHGHYAGVLRSGGATVFDQVATATGTSTPVSTGLLTPTERNEFAIAGFSYLNVAGVFTNPNAGWTIRDRATGAGGASVARSLSLLDNTSIPNGVAVEPICDGSLSNEWIAMQVQGRTEPLYTGWDYPTELARDRLELTLEVQHPRTVDLWVF